MPRNRTALFSALRSVLAAVLLSVFTSFTIQVPCLLTVNPRICLAIIQRFGKDKQLPIAPSRAEAQKLSER